MMYNFQTPQMMAEERRLVAAWISWVEEDPTKPPEVCVCYSYIILAHYMYISVIETHQSSRVFAPPW